MEKHIGSVWTLFLLLKFDRSFDKANKNKEVKKTTQNLEILYTSTFEDIKKHINIFKKVCEVLAKV